MSRKLTIVLLLTVALIGVPGALALPEFLTAFQQVYTDGSCGTCHVDPAGGGPRNTYGTMFENQPNHDSDPVSALKTIGPAPGTSSLATATPTPTSISPQIVTPVLITNVTVPTHNLTLTLNATMDDNPPIVNNITNAVLLDTSGNTIATATLPDNMTAQFNLSGIIPGDYFIEVNGLAGDHLPTRIDSNASDINQSAGLRLQHSIIGNISNPTYRIEVFPSGLDSHPVVNYATVLNETIYNFVIVPGNTSRIEVRVLNTSAELSNFSTVLSTHDGLSVPFQKWILGDFTDSTGAFIGNHGLVYNNTDSNCNGCHGSLDTKAANISDIAPNNGWCFRCHNGKTGPDNGFIDPRAVVAANGTIAGNVTNASSGLTISGATVAANGMMATTDTNGSYNISIAAGTYNVTANATGFKTNTTTGVIVTSGNVTTQNVALTPTAAPVVVPVLTTITVSPSTATLNVNGTQVINATAMDQNNTPMAGINISWTVDNSTVGNVSTLNAVTDTNGNANTTFTALAIGNAMVNATNGTVSGNATITVTAPTPAAPTPKLTLKLNSTMDGTSPPLVNNITSAILLDTSGNTSATATLPDNMIAQFNLSGIIPGDYFIEVNGFAGDLLPTRIDSNTSDINQSAGMRMRNSFIGDISNPTYRIKVYPSGNPPVVNSSHPVVNYATGANESIFNYIIVPANPNKIEVRVLGTDALLSNFTSPSANHPTGDPFQKWILDFPGSPTNHGHVYNNTDSNCNLCHGNLSTKAPNFSAITPGNGWCFRCHYGKTGPRNGFVDPTGVVAANGAIAGTVTNASSGLAIAGATVAADTQSNITDANGNYSISIAAGTYTVAASATGYQTNTTTGVVVTSGNVTTQDFALIPVAAVPPSQAAFNISGFKINNATGSGIQGWNITVMNATMQKSMLTGADGSYKFTDLVNGTYNVSEEMKPGFTPVGATLQGVTINGSDVTNVNFTNNPISAANRTFVADLTGGEEVPPEVTLARANATFNLSDDGTVLQFKVTVANITNATASHIHLAPVGVNGSIVVNLFTGPTKTGRFDGVLAEGNITQADLIGLLAGQPFSALLDNMTNGNTYVNIHTTQHPAGEIRGQIRVAPVPNARFSISGFKINNATKNGIQGWNITLRNGTTNALIDSKPTDANGFYQFIVLVNGSYNVSEEMKAGFTSINATSMPVTVENMDVMNVNFTNQVTVPPPQTFNISGFKVNDTNGDNIWEPGEMGIENWNIMLLNATTGTRINSTSTNASGFYEFMNLAPGVYNVTEEMKAGFTPSSATFKVVTIENMDVTDVDFLNHVAVPPPQTFNISGFKINGTDNNGMGIENWNIMLLNDTGAQIASTMTDSTGIYNFTGLTNGTYNVTEGMMTGWTNTSTSPMSQMVVINGADVPDVNFTNMLLPPAPVTTFNISGFKINDTNGNGVWDPGEMGIEGWNIMLLDDKGAQIASTSTDASGSYKFTNVSPGSYNVTEEMKAGFTPSGATFKIVTVENMDVSDVNFTNQVTVTPKQTFNISGFKVNDTNGNNVWDSGEMGIEGWNIMLLDDKGTQIASTSTDAQGFYEFTGLDPGTYIVTEEMKAGFTPSSDTSKDVTIENKDVKDVNFLNHVTVPPAVTNTISGFKINDLNGNGKQDPGEEGLPGWNIRLIGIVPGTAGINEEATTDDKGFYSFENLPAGMYLVVETLQGGYVPVGSPVLVINLANGMNSMNNNFMNRPVSSLIPSLPGISAKHR